MRIAEDIAKDGVLAGTQFTDAITDLVYTNKMTRIIETGTYHGTGTTRAVLNGIHKHKVKPVHFVSIEVNPEYYATARRNTFGEPVSILKGLSIPKGLLPKKSEITFEGFTDETIIDHQPESRQELYYKETNYNVNDARLIEAMMIVDYRPELVILDSAGHIGTLEFDYLMSLVSGGFYLCLDDTRHVKHSKTVQKIETDHRFTLIKAFEEKFGSRIYKVQID